jgi:hypothetical protein
MNKFIFSFSGRQLGSLGAFEIFELELEGENLLDAKQKIWNTHQDVGLLKVLWDDKWVDIEV